MYIPSDTFLYCMSMIFISYHLLKYLEGLLIHEEVNEGRSANVTEMETHGHV